MIRMGNVIFLVLANALACAAPVPTLAHGGRVPLEQWGGFAPATAVCQRALVDATLRCARSTWEISRKCSAAEGAGEPCNRPNAEQRIAAVRRNALDLIDVRCNDFQLGQLGFLGQFDMRADVTIACSSWRDLMESATFATTATSDPGCIAESARVLTRATGDIFIGWKRTLRRIATEPDLALERKEQLVAREQERLPRFVARATTALTAKCGATEAARLARVVALGVCTPASVCVQGAVICPEPICGNGLIEPGELCDDGNVEPGDGCEPACGM